jgi:hypothetical protein
MLLGNGTAASARGAISTESNNASERITTRASMDMAPACDRSTCDGQAADLERLIDASRCYDLAFERRRGGL